MEVHPISDKGSVTNFGLLADEDRQIVKRFLEGKAETTESEPSYGHEILEKLPGLYRSYMNGKLNRRGIKPLSKSVEGIQNLHIYPFHLPDPNQVGTVWSLECVQEEAFSEDILTITSSATNRMDGQSVLLSDSLHSALSSSRT